MRWRTMGRTFQVRTMSSPLSTHTLMPRHVHNKDPLSKYAHADPLQAHRGRSRSSSGYTSRSTSRSRSRSRSRSASSKSAPRRPTPPPPERGDGDQDRSPATLRPAIRSPAVTPLGARGATASSSRAESSGQSGAGRAAAPKAPATSMRISAAALPSRRGDVDPGVKAMVTPTPAPIAEVASQRPRVIHGNIEWAQALTPEQMLRRGWFVRGKNHDPRHLSYSVWMITNDSPRQGLVQVGSGHYCESRVGAQGAGLNGSNGRHYARVHVAGSQHEETMWPFVLSQAEGHLKGGLSAQIR